MAALDVDAHKGNIQQRVFGVFPPFPQTVTIYSVIASLPGIDRHSVLEAVARLCRHRLVEPMGSGRHRLYRLRPGARWPIDMRGHHGNSGRRPRAG